MTDASPPLKRTPLFNDHLKLNARMTPFGGWEMPLSYEGGQIAEHEAVRSSVGIFDVSHMGQVRITGPGALPFIQYLVPADFTGLSNGKGKYTQLCNAEGGVVDDLIITRISEDEFFAVVNAATRENDVAWMKRHGADFNCLVKDESEQWAMIAVQGPEALKLLEEAVPGTKWSETEAFTLHSFQHERRPHLLSRTGYTGETGAELLCPAELAGKWWHRLLDAGAKPCGLAARDSLRLEAGYCLYGQDLNEETTPVEASLSWSIGWDKEEKFIGREVLEKQKEEKPPRRLVGLLSDHRRPIRCHDKVYQDGRQVGEVTSGGFSPQLKKGIALAYVETPQAKKETRLEVETGGKRFSVAVTRPPFVKTSLSK